MTQAAEHACGSMLSLKHLRPWQHHLAYIHRFEVLAPHLSPYSLFPCLDAALSMDPQSAYGACFGSLGLTPAPTLFPPASAPWELQEVRSRQAACYALRAFQSRSLSPIASFRLQKDSDASWPLALSWPLESLPKFFIRGLLGRAKKTSEFHIRSAVEPRPDVQGAQPASMKEYSSNDTGILNMT